MRSKSEQERIAGIGRRIVNGIHSDDGGDYYFLDGKEVTEAQYRNLYPIPDSGRPSGTKGKGWPLRSDALGCHPEQVVEMNERNREAGIGTRYDGDGTAVIPDRADRKRLLKLEQKHDKDGGYGDG